MKDPVLVDSRHDVLLNIATMEDYMCNGSDEEYNEVLGYIRRGHKFICYKVLGEYHFAPSRFIGYKNNNLTKHKRYKSNRLVSGSITDSKLSKQDILGEPMYSDKIEKRYINYCKSLKVIPYNINRHFWIIDDNIQLPTKRDDPYEEGTSKLYSHLRRERNSKLIKDAKLNFKNKNGGRLFCEVCGFDFFDTYGKLGLDFIEAHHKTPLANSDCKHAVCFDDLAMVCSNCHRMLHKELDVLTIESLRKIIKKNK